MLVLLPIPHSTLLSLSSVSLLARLPTPLVSDSPFHLVALGTASTSARSCVTTIPTTWAIPSSPASCLDAVQAFFGQRKALS